MSTNEETTNALLAKSLKELLKTTNFEKITIKEITNNAGLIRPTFYNHFSDKYALLEWIFYNDVIVPAMLLIEDDMLKEAIDLMLKQIERDMKFYSKAAKIDGQNSFENIVYGLFGKLFLSLFSGKNKFKVKHLSPITPEILAKYYANGLTFIIINWLENASSLSAVTISEIYQTISNISINELVKPSIDDN
ncbi:MAG: TetR/AcrR family transcriptional regulator C-terminal domain-containing protein [Acidaminococcaceae bacterium]|nr:TetR/AcrR family transcriptional regulator C-terminal domain-containing protein [Acidaminococcaceae bacterium]MDD4721945.1 TetR/AcrR family transcriptional regulator C-terminal domain-containing protein [Acidaminococcaceae bacterium]